MNEIAIVLNTKERNHILKRVLRYYKIYGFKGSIYIGNAGSINSYNELNDYISTIKEYNIKHVHYPQYNQQYLNGVTVKDLLKFVKEKYVIVTGDDDYINLDNIDLYYNFLENNFEYSCCHGYGLQYNLDINKPTDLIKTYSHENSTPSNRILELTSNYQVLQLSLTRRDILIESYEDIEYIIDPYLVELFVVLKIVILGKTKKFNKIHILRGYFSKKKRVGSKFHLDDIAGKDTSSSILYFIDYFEKFKKEIDSNILNNTKLFLTNYYGRKLSKNYNQYIVKKEKYFSKFFYRLRKIYFYFILFIYIKKKGKMHKFLNKSSL